MSPVTSCPRLVRSWSWWSTNYASAGESSGLPGSVPRMSASELSPLVVGPVIGECDDRFAGVREVFAENFASFGESGAAVSVWLDGRCVVDLGGGFADHRTERPWSSDTLQLVFSTTKGLAAATVLSLWEDGTIDIDAPIVQCWPEFAAGGKERVTTRHVLSHQSGLAAFADRITPEECSVPGFAAARLAGQTPDWEPGTAHGYHALSYGWLLGEIVLRATGKTLGTMWRERFGDPLGLDTWIGLPESEQGRVSRLRQESVPVLTGPDEGQAAFVEALMTKGTLTRRVFSNPTQVGIFNDPALHRSEWPAANGITDARSLATFYGHLATDRALRPETIAQARTTQSEGIDLVLRRANRFGLGYNLACETDALAHAPGGMAFGHAGAGGSIGFADPVSGLGFAYVMTQMHSNISADPRRDRLVDAVYAGLAAD